MPESSEIVIQPEGQSLGFHVREILQYRDLLFFLTQRDLIARYQQTRLGPLWLVLQPLLTTLVFMLVFGLGLGIPTAGVPPLLFYLCGLLPWTFFSQALTAISSSLIDHFHLFNKVYFPRLVIPLAILFSQLISFAIQLFIFLCAYGYFKGLSAASAQIHFTGTWVWQLPLMLLQTAALSLGAGLWIAALTVRYRDLQRLVGVMMQLWLYLTPVIYAYAGVSRRAQFFLQWNPMTCVVESFRQGFLGGSALPSVCIFISAGLTCAVLGSGLWMFQRIERDFVDTL